ncbi:MAG: hypothetical protein R3B81_01980 [bacterium]
MNRSYHHRSALVPAALVLLAGASSSRATTWNVLPDGTGDFATIQAAIDAATDGDVIELANGTFTGVGNRDIDFLGKAITIRSVSGNPETCVVDAEYAHGGGGECNVRGFIFRTGEDSDSVLDGVTITRASGDGCPVVGIDELGGTAIAIDGASPIVRNVVVTECTGDVGGVQVVGVFEGDPTFENCVVRQSAGIALALVQSSATVTGCLIEANGTWLSSGAAVFISGGAPRLASTAIVRNGHGGFLQGPFFGGGVFAGGSASFEGCLIAENGTQGTGGGVYSTGNTTITRTTIAGNRAAIGGGLVVASGTCTVTQSVIGANCSSSEGPDIYAIGNVFIDCSAVNPAAATGLVNWGTTIVADDPLFCEPRTCIGTDPGLYSLQLLSPARDVPGCGTLGALYGVCTVSVAPMSWGRVKEMYRN